MAILPIVLLAGLAGLGAGLVPGVALPTAAVLLLAACLRPLPTNRAFRVCFWFYAVLLAWTAFTLVPVGSLAGAWRGCAWEEANRFVAQYAALWGGGVAPAVPRLTLHADGTLRWLVLLAGMGGMFCLTASLRTSQRFALMRGLVIVGGGVAITGIVGRYVIPQGGLLCWWYPVSEIDSGTPFGPFVSRNDFASFCALLTPLSLVLLCHTTAPSWGEGDAVAAADDDAPLALSPVERLLHGACLALMVAAALSTRSRGGAAAILLGFVVTALFWVRWRPAAAATAMLGGVGAIVLVALWPDAEFQVRLHDMRKAGSVLGARWPIWLDSVRLWTHVPLAGCGANACGMLFPQVSNWTAGVQATHAESECLQILADGGAVGALLVACTLGLCCWPLAQALGASGASRHGRSGNLTTEEERDRSTAVDSCLPSALLAGVGGALAAIAFQSLFGTPCRVPLCGWAAAAVAGLAAPLPALRHEANGGWFRRWRERVALLVVLAGVLMIGWWRPGWQALYRDCDAWLAEAAPAEIVSLLRQTPTYWQGWCELGYRLCAQSDQSTDLQRDGLQTAGWSAIRCAVRSNPRDPRLRGAFAERLWLAGQLEEARQHRDVQLTLMPQEYGLRRHWLEAEWQAGCVEEARQLAYRFAAECTTDPRSVGHLTWLAEHELVGGSVVAARLALLTVLQQRPDDERVLRGLAECDRRLGDTVQEAVWLQRLLQSGHETAALWWRLAEFAKAQGDRRALEHALGMAVRLDPARRREANAFWKAGIETPPRRAATPEEATELRRSEHVMP